MKKLIAALVASTLGLVVVSSAAGANGPLGSACLKLGTKKVVEGKTYTCRLFWSLKPSSVATRIEVPGPTVTATVPGPTTTISVPGPTITATVPGPTVTVTAPAPTPSTTSTPTVTPTSAATLVVGNFYSGQDNDDTNWKWVAVRVSNSSSTSVLPHRYYQAYISDGSGTVVDSSFIANFPQLAPSGSAWFTTTQFNTKASSQISFVKQYPTIVWDFTTSDIPTITNPRLVASTYSPSRKAVAFTLRNNSNKVLSQSSTAFVVLLDGSGKPVYADSGFIGSSILPGGSGEITVGDFTYNGSYSSIAVSISCIWP